MNFRKTFKTVRLPENKAQGDDPSPRSRHLLSPDRILLKTEAVRNMVYYNIFFFPRQAVKA